MKVKKVFGAISIVVCLITGCASNPMAAVYSNDQKIASETNTYNLDNVDQTIEDGHFMASVDKMEGMDTIWVLDAGEDTTLDITYTVSVFSGKMKLVLINSKGEISIIVECDTEMTEPVQRTLNVEKGNSRIKIVADKNTKFDIDISISEGDFKNLGMTSHN